MLPLSDPDSPGNNVLLLSSKGATEHMHNHVETTLNGGLSVVNGRVYEISYRARWLSGGGRLHVRQYFDRLPRTHRKSINLKQWKATIKAAPWK